MHRDVEKILFSEEEIAKRINELGQIITEDYKGTELIVVGILKGANIFMSDLVRKIQTKLEMDFMVVSSYGNSSKTSGVVRILKDLDLDVENKNVLIVEDIIDTGLTLTYLKEYLINRKAESVKICTLLNKTCRRQSEVPIDYVGYEVPDEFIIGYGIDYAEHYRNLPYIAALKREVYSE